MQKGRKQSEESKQKNREWHLGRKQSKETIEKRRVSLLKTYSNQESRDNCRDAQARIWSNPERMEKHLRKLEGEWLNPDYRERQTESRKKAWTPERCAQHSAFMKELWSDPDFAKKQSEINQNNWDTIIDHEKHRESMRASWTDPEKKAARLKKYFENWDRRPNNIEQMVIWVCKMHDLPFEYVGDGGVWLGGCNPDFIRKDGTKQIIEVFGDYWHEDEEPERQATFKRFGYDTLVIWEHEIQDDLKAVTEKIREFTNG